jgi:hypothetical protein
MSTMAVVETTRVSDSTMASNRKMLGLKAVMAATIRPTRSPAIRRPARPMATTPPMPSTQDATWCHRNERIPSSENPASTVR